MSRFVSRFIAGAVLAAVLPMAAGAQLSCTVVEPATTCNVVVSTTIDIPKLAFLQTTTNSLDFSLTSGEWSTLLGSTFADTTIRRQFNLTAKSNTARTISITTNLNSGPNAPFLLSDLRFGEIAVGTCGAGDVVNTLTSPQAVTGLNGGASVGVTRTICIGLNIPNDLSSTKLAPTVNQTIQFTAEISAP